jgi:hypothetical protein
MILSLAGLSLTLNNLLVLNRALDWTTPLRSGLAGTLPTIFFYPLDIWEQRWKTEVKDLSHLSSSQRRALMMDAGRQVHRDRAYFRGLGAKLVSATPFNTINGSLFRMYLSWTATAPRSLSQSYQDMWVKYKYGAILSGGMAAACTVSLTHGFDTIVRRVQVSNESGMHFGRMMTRLWRKESNRQITSMIRILYAGFPPNLIKCIVTYSWRWFGFTNLAGLDVEKLARKTST